MSGAYGYDPKVNVARERPSLVFLKTQNLLDLLNPRPNGRPARLRQFT